MSCRINIEDALLGQLGLQFPDSGMQSVELPVEIGGIDLVAVDEKETSDTQARESFSCERSDTAQPENSCFGVGKPPGAVLAYQWQRAGEERI